MIRQLVGRRVRDIQKSILWNYKSSDCRSDRIIDKCYLLEYLKKYTDRNFDVQYKATADLDIDQEGTYKWVGAQEINGVIVGIPNDANAILLIDDAGYKLVGKFKQTAFKWTGGRIINGKLYCYPRSENCVLTYHLESASCELHNLNINYKKEHHYGGVCIDDKVVIQPPRNTDHFIVWNTADFSVQKIQIAPKWWKMQFRYSASILHPNGFVYFIPETEGRVIKLNPQNMKWRFIGREYYPTVFDAKVAVDGNIYGYTSTAKGIIKIDVAKESVTILHDDIFFGAYGTKLGINGKLYSVPGNGSYVWEFDPIADQLTKLDIKLSDEPGKMAGGATQKNGNIICVPSHGDYILRLNVSKNNCVVPDDLYKIFFEDNY